MESCIENTNTPPTDGLRCYDIFAKTIAEVVRSLMLLSLLLLLPWLSIKLYLLLTNLLSLLSSLLLGYSLPSPSNLTRGGNDRPLSLWVLRIKEKVLNTLPTASLSLFKLYDFPKALILMKEN